MPSYALNLFLPQAFHSASMLAVAQEPETASLPVSAARQGDPQAWDILLRRYQLPVFAYVMDLVRHHATSLDLVQETFVRASQHLAHLRDDFRFGSWLFGIAHQQVLQFLRRKGRSPFSDDPIPDDTQDSAPAPDIETIRDEDAAGLYRAIDALPTPQRSVILLHFLEDFSLAEIAEITGTNVGTVKSRLHYAKRTLKERLSNPSPENRR